MTLFSACHYSSMTLLSVTGFFAVGRFTVEHFAVGQFAVRTLWRGTVRRRDPCMQNTEKTINYAKYGVDANLFRLGSTNPKKNIQLLDVFLVSLRQAVPRQTVLTAKCPTANCPTARNIRTFYFTENIEITLPKTCSLPTRGKIHRTTAQNRYIIRVQ